MRNSLRSVLYVCLFVCLAALIALSPAAAWGQSAATGTIVGSVVDNTNAVVPGATVTIMLTTTGTVRATTSDNQGRFVFADVQPGAYTVNVSKQGFSATVVTNQVVKIGTQLTENVKMQVGAISTTVTVTENPGAELQTMDATVGATLSGAIITNLPNTSRDASTLAIFQPGQNINGATGGAETDQNSFQLDGGYATDDMSGDNNTYIASFSADTAGGSGAMHSQGFNQAPSAVVPIPVSTVEEFKVSTSNQSADFNGGAGSQMQIVTKRGTNTFHGTAYDYYLDNNFGGANTWDNNSTGFKQPGSHFSRFGADAGGKIPHSNFAGGSWFVFGGYEGFRFPNASVFERSFPTASLRAGLIALDGDVVNLNQTNSNVPVVVNGTTINPPVGGWPANSGFNTTTNTADPCLSGAGGTPGPCDPRNLGMNPVISSLWSTYLPLPNDCNQGDAANFCGYKGSIGTPQKSNFGIARIDHDFAKNEHFNATYHYYKLTHTVSDQWEIGNFFGNNPGPNYLAIRQKPQNPWIYTAGLTTDVSSNVTNDFHFSYTRNWWAYLDPSGVPNVAGFPAALEIGGENSGGDTTNSPIFGPYNTNNQSTRYRYWNGHDYMLRDDVTWIKGNHLFQYGGSWLRNRDTHLRNDNGESINTFEQYIIGDGMNTELSSNVNVSIAPFIPAGISSSTTNYENLYSTVLGMVDQTQSLFTRGLGNQITGLPLDPRKTCAITGVAATASCIASPPLLNSSIIPTYNAYLTDSWHMRPNFSLNYGLGYTVEMPPYETNGGFQTVMVDQSGNIMRAMDYLNNERQAALLGLPYAPAIGFETVRNVPHHSRYPYDPFYGGISPRIGMAWNFRPDTVVRAGYATIWGRINGVNPILVPMLTPGLMQPSVCLGPTNTGACGTAANNTTPVNGFRVGTAAGFDGVNAPLPPPSITASGNQPQPWYPGINDVATGSGETIDPVFHPDRSDEFTLSVQHQFGPKILAEAGYIGRMISNEVQYYSLSNIPYMMTQGGQTFADAWKNIMLATNYGTGVNYGSVNATANLTAPPVQPFFEAAINPAVVNCTPSCTAAFVAINSKATAGLGGNNNMWLSDPYDAWSTISSANGWNFGRSMTSDPLPLTCATPTGIGCGGQTSSILTTVSNGFGNYNAGYLQLTTTDWHGLTMKTNFSYSNALGTGNVVQASSSFSTNDPWNLHNAYGAQSYNEKFVFNLFLNYASPYYASQKGAIGRLLGGWSFSPLFVWGSGFPIEVGTGNGDCGTFGECNTAFVGALENGIFTQNLHYNATRHTSSGGKVVSPFDPTKTVSCGTSTAGFNVFGDPTLTCPVGRGIFGDPVRDPILGLDGQMGGGGPVTGLPFWNVDLGITKKINILERLSGSLYFDFTNVTNHMQPADPALNIFSRGSWGALGGGGNLQGNTPRRLQLGLTIDW